MERDRFFQAIRGTVMVRNAELSFEADVAARAPSDLRVEVSGPLGVKIGLLVMNEEWVKFAVLRDKLLLRIPKAEIEKRSLRAERFLSAIVVPLPPSVMVEAVTTQSPLANGAKLLACRYSHEFNRYELRLADPKSKGGTHLAVDPSTLAPLEWRRYDAFLPDLGSSAAERYDHRIVFGRLQGGGLATMPAEAGLWVSEKARSAKPETELKWSQVEAWPDALNSAFDYNAPAAFRVKDY